MDLIQQSTTAIPLMFLMVDSGDHVTPKTGLTPTVTISKNGGSFASPAGTVSEVGSGWYKVAGNATDTATLGTLTLHATGSGADPCDEKYMVVAFDPLNAVRLGLTALPNAVAGANGGVPTGDANGRVGVQVGTSAGMLDTTSGVVKANTTQFGGSAVVHTTGKVWALDGDGNPIAPASATTAIKNKTDQLTFTTANQVDSRVMSILDGVITSAKFTVSAITGVASGILEKIDQTWRRWFKKAVHDTDAETLKTYADDGTTIITTQTLAEDDAGVETQGAAS
jgi:hypothetical protein